MIITCPNCDKQFKIDNSLITDEGRDLQCGSCNHVWFYKIEEENFKVLKLNEKILNKDNEINSKDKESNIEEKKKQIKIPKTETKNEKKEKINEKKKNKSTSNNVSQFFSYLIVFILSFVALIILIDTLKTPLIDVFPGLEIILFTLYETLQDIKLFIIDLF